MASELNKFYFDNKFKMDESLAYGIYKDRTLSVIERGSYVKVSVGFNSQINQQAGQQISFKLKELKGKHRALQHALTTNVGVELVIYKSADFAYEFIMVVDECLSVIDKYVPAMVDVCPICGQIKPSDAPFVKIKDTVIQAHDSCIDQLIGASNQMGTNLLLKFNKKEFFKALLACFITFLIVTGIICIAAYYKAFGFVSVISGWGAFALSNVILKKMRIQIRKDQIILVSIFSILSVFSSIYFGSIIDIFRANDNVSIGFVFANYFKIITQNFAGVGKYILLSLVLSLALVIPTIVINIKQLHQSVNAIKKLK